VTFAVVLAFITYIDRICIAKAEPLISAELGFDKRQMGWVFAAFAWAYGLFEIPWGWLGDRIGARKVLMRVVVWWSIFTAATGAAWNFSSMIVMRALFGAGEAGCFPNIAKTFATWLPPHERARAQGILWLGARVGGALTPILVVGVLELMPWRPAFAFFGSLGIIWAVFYGRWYRDDPRAHPGVNAAERALLPEPRTPRRSDPIPWRRFLCSVRVWMLWIQYACLAYGFYFYMTWLPKYLEEVRKVKGGEGALLAGLPMLLAGVGSVSCGFFLPRLARWTGGASRARRIMAVIGFGGAGVLTFLSLKVADPTLAMLVLGMAGFANDLAMPPSWEACTDLGGRFTGSLSGGMNMMSCVGAALFPVVAAYILEDWAPGNWNVVFYVSAAVYGAGMICWFFIDSATSLDVGPKEGVA
jgi:MFS family permease